MIRVSVRVCVKGMLGVYGLVIYAIRANMNLISEFIMYELEIYELEMTVNWQIKVLVNFVY